MAENGRREEGSGVLDETDGFKEREVEGGERGGGGIGESGWESLDRKELPRFAGTDVNGGGSGRGPAVIVVGKGEVRAVDLGGPAGGV